MNAKIYNAFLAAAFTHGGRGDMILGIGEPAQKENKQAHQIMMRGLREFGTIQDNICAAQAEKVRAANERIPF